MDHPTLLVFLYYGGNPGGRDPTQGGKHIYSQNRSSPSESAFKETVPVARDS